MVGLSEKKTPSERERYKPKQESQPLMIRQYFWISKRYSYHPVPS